MEGSRASSHRYWRDVLTGGGSTVLPRCSAEPSAGMLRAEVPLEPELVAGLRGLAGTLAVSLTSVLLAGHVRVLAALCGRRDVAVGYVARGAGVPLPCRLDSGCRSWRELLAESFRVESAALTHRRVRVDELRAQLGVAGPVFETVFDPTGGDGFGEAGGGTAVLWVAVVECEGRLCLSLRCLGEVWDLQTLSRVGRYHLRALESIAGDVDSEHAALPIAVGGPMSAELAELDRSTRALRSAPS